MNINRHNYEEFFILYMDNELSSEDRLQVESFIQQNPDLKEELELLLQSRLVPESYIVFENKEELLQPEENGLINVSNYEEWLLLYVDDELSQKERNDVEKFIAAHPEAKKELKVLIKTKSVPEESIVFPDKESLYRRAEKVRVISIRYWRAAAAAILILGIGITAFFSLNNKKGSVSGPVASHGVKTANDTNAGVANKITVNNPVAQTEIKEEVLRKDMPQQTDNLTFSKKENNGITAPHNIPVKTPEPIIDNKVPLLTDNTPANNSMATQPDPGIKIIASSSVPDLAVNEIPNNVIANLNEAPAVTNSPENSYINKGITAGSNADFAEQDEKGNKRIRGLFRKVTRFFEKTTRINPTNNDDQLLIGAVAVKLK